MNTEIVKISNPRLLNLAVYLIVIFVAGIGAFSIPGDGLKASIFGLCILFCLVHFWGFAQTETPRRLSLHFIIQAAIVLTLLRLSRPSDLFILFFYILALEAITSLPARLALAWVAGFFLLGSLNALVNLGQDGIIGIFYYAAAFLMTAVYGHALRQTEIARRKNEDLLEELKTTQQKVHELAVTEERSRMAREMHDSLGHRLTVTIVQLEGAQRMIPTDPVRAARMVGAMREEMKEALSELRRTVSALRAPISSQESIDVTLSNLAKSFEQRTGIPTHFWVSSGFPGLPENYRQAFYRAAQEALTNIQRHAMARNAWMKLSADDQKVNLVMEDDGKGMDRVSENRTGTGIRGMEERAVQLGGEMKMVDRHGGGTLLVFSVPLPKTGIDV